MSKESNASDAQRYLGDIYNPHTEIDECTKAIQLDPDNAEAYFNRGCEYAQWGEGDKAIADYTKAIQIDPDYVLAYRSRGEAYSRSLAKCGTTIKYDEAFADYTKAIQIDPDNAESYRARGYFRGPSDGAIADYTKAIQIDPEEAWVYRERARIYYRLGKLDEAIADWTELNRILVARNGSGCVTVYEQRGRAYREQGKFDEAIADFTEVMRLRPLEYKNDGNGFGVAIARGVVAKAYYNRGVAYLEQGKLDEAIADYTETIRLDPNDAVAYNNRGVAYERQRNDVKAGADFAKCKELCTAEEARYA